MSPEIARRLETCRNIVWRWKEGLARPNKHHCKELLELAESLFPQDSINRACCFTSRLGARPVDSPGCSAGLRNTP